MTARVPRGVQVEARTEWERHVLLGFVDRAPADGEVPDYVKALSESMLHVRASEVIAERDLTLVAKDAQCALEVQRRDDVIAELRRILAVRDRQVDRLRGDLVTLTDGGASE